MKRTVDYKKIQILTNVISSAFSVDVGVVNRESIAIAGTGDYAKNIGIARPKESYVVQSITAGEEFLLENATYARHCYLCDIRKSCPYMMVSFNPIIMGDQVQACLMLLASNQDQRNILAKRSRDFKRQLSKVSVLFSDMLQTRKCDNRKDPGAELNSIVDFFEEALLVTNRIGKITSINAAAKHFLRCRSGDVLGAEIDDLLFSEGCKWILSGKGLEPRGLPFPGKHDLIFSAKPILVNREFEGYVIRLRKLTTRLTAKPILLSEGGSFARILGKSPALQRVINEARRIAHSKSTVLLLGETGTGKELFAEAIHQEGFRHKEPFVVLNCSAMPDKLLESEMFGYEEGAFTGAKKGGKPGKFEAADRGTLFLDEIGDFPLALQAKLLRVLEDGHIEKIGSTRKNKVDVRIIAATNRNLLEMVGNRTFREDLYYRLNAVPIFLPPLRERRDDIPLLIEHFISQFLMTTDLAPKSVSHEIEHLFLSYPWPGNIRELKNTVEYLLQVTSGKTITVSDLPYPMKALFYKSIRDHEKTESSSTLQCLEREAIEKALKQFGDNTEGKKKAAKSLGISLATLYRRLNLYYSGSALARIKNIRVVVKYCGGCNSRYDRKECVDEFFERTSNLNLVRVLPGFSAEYVLIVCGCPSSCANHSDNHALARFPLVINEKSDLEKILETIADRDAHEKNS